jgi:prepilin-type N-terminal cleavage/methylation domain-containing protein
MRLNRILGFTLAELLIALAILGVISTFTIPKLLTASANQKRNAILKECIGVIQETYHRGWIEGVLKDGVIAAPYILNQVGAIKICDTDADVQGCWPIATHPANIDSWQTTQAGFVLASGCTVAGVDTVGMASGDDYLILDWNGPTGPNLEGTDQAEVIVCVKQGGTCTGSQRPGTFKGLFGPSRTLVESVYLDN